MIPRHHDYQLTVASVPVGGIKEVPLRLDSDSEFALRLVRSRNIGLNGWRFTTPRRAYQSSQLRTDVSNTSGGFFLPTRGVPVYPEMIYPPGSTILVDIGNTGGAPIVNARVLFRGSKRFADGTFPTSTYPPRFSPLAFQYPVVVQNVPVAGTIRDNQLRIRHDADFVFRYGVCDAFTLGVEGQGMGNAPAQLFGFPELAVGASYREVYVQVRDESRKAYSNEPIHVNDLFGQGSPNGQFPLTPFPGQNQNDDQVLFFPGLWTPEIYIQADHSLYFDIVRNDTGVVFPGTASTVPVDLHFRFGGAKVFRR